MLPQVRVSADGPSVINVDIFLQLAKASAAVLPMMQANYEPTLSESGNQKLQHITLCPASDLAVCLPDQFGTSSQGLWNGSWSVEGMVTCAGSIPFGQTTAETTIASRMGFSGSGRASDWDALDYERRWQVLAGHVRRMEHKY